MQLTAGSVYRHSRSSLSLSRSRFSRHSIASAKTQATYPFSRLCVQFTSIIVNIVLGWPCEFSCASKWLLSPAAGPKRQVFRRGRTAKEVCMFGACVASKSFSPASHRLRCLCAVPKGPNPAANESTCGETSNGPVEKPIASLLLGGPCDTIKAVVGQNFYSSGLYYLCQCCRYTHTLPTPALNGC